MENMVKSESIVDNKLYIRHNAIGFHKRNYDFQYDSFIKGHLANQLLLYDKIIIPTRDFGIIPVLIKWMSLKLFIKAIDSNTFYFLRVKDAVGYFGGDGDGIITFTAGRGKSKTWSWPQDAMFGENNIAIEQQLRNFCPDISKQERESIIKNIISKSKTLRNIDKAYEKYITDETYEDVKGDSELSQYIFHKSGKEINNDDFRRLEGIEKNQIRILHQKKNRDPIDLLLQIAEINMILYFSTLFEGADLFVPDGAETLLKNKILRLGIKDNYLDNFIVLLELKNIPNIGKAVQSGDFSLFDIWKIREKKHSKNFRKWLRKASKQDEKNIVKLYIESLENTPLIQSLPVKVLKFASVAISSLICPLLGLTLGIGDSFFAEQWLKGYSPKLFLDELLKIKIDNRE